MPWRRTGVILLILLFGQMVTIDQTMLANSVFADENGAVKKPKVRLSPEIPIESDNTNDSGGWFGWIALGAAAVASTVGAIAASGGGSDDGGGGEADDDTPTTQYRTDW